MESWIRLLAVACLALAASACGGETAPASAGSVDLSTPTATLAEFKRTLNTRAWREHYDLFSEDSLDSLLLPCFILPQGDPELSRKHREILDKYVSPAIPGAPRKDPLSGLSDRVSD